MGKAVIGMKAQPVTENPVLVGMGNFKDCIYNMVRNTQIYFNNLYGYVPKIYPEILEQKGEYYPLADFLFQNADKIIIHEGIFFTMQTQDLISRKFKEVEELVCAKASTKTYEIPNTAFSFIYDHKPYSDWANGKVNVYTKKTVEEESKAYQLESYLNRSFVEAKVHLKKNMRMQYYSKQSLLSEFGRFNVEIFDTLHYLQTLAKKATSPYEIARIIQLTIDILVFTYTAICFIVTQ